MKDNWKALGDKVKTELDQQQAPIPDFKEFVKYRNTVNTPSPKSGFGSSIGPGIMKWLPLLIIAGALTVFYPKIKSTFSTSTESDAPQKEVISTNAMGSIFQNTESGNKATSKINDVSVAKDVNETKIVTAENKQKIDLSSNTNEVAANTSSSNMVINDETEVGNTTNDIVPANYSTAVSKSFTTTKSEVDIDNIQNIKGITSSIEDYQKIKNLNNIPIQMAGSDYVITDSQLNLTTTGTNTVLFNGSSSQENSNNSITEITEKNNQSVSLSEQLKKSRLASLMTQSLSTLPLLPSFTDNNASTSLEGLNLSNQEIEPVLQKKKIRHSLLLGLNANKWKLKNINLYFGYLISRPIFEKYGIGIQTGLKYNKINEKIKTQWLETYVDNTGFGVTSETNSQDSMFHMVELPLEITWNVNNNDKFKFHIGIARQWVAASDGNYKRQTFFSGGTSTSSSEGGISRQFKRANMTASFGLEYSINSNISIGGSFNRAITSWLKTFKPDDKTENYDGGVSGNLRLDNGRIYARYQF